MKRISIDIDGVLNYYPIPWVEFLNKELNSSFKTYFEAKQNCDPKKYKLAKNKYRNSQFKATLPVNKESVDTLQKFHNLGYDILISTSRPISSPEFPNLYNLTYKWLVNNNIPFSKLLFKSASHEFISLVQEVEFHVDDELKYCELFAQHGIRSYLMNSSAIPKTPLIKSINSLKDLFNILIK